MKSNNVAEQLNSLREAAKARLAEIEAEAAELRSALGDGPARTMSSLSIIEARPPRKARVTVIPPAEPKPRKRAAELSDVELLGLEAQIGTYLADVSESAGAEAIARALDADAPSVSKILKRLVKRGEVITSGAKRGTKYQSAVRGEANGIGAELS